MIVICINDNWSTNNPNEIQPPPDLLYPVKDNLYEVIGIHHEGLRSIWDLLNTDCTYLVLRESNPKWGWRASHFRPIDIEINQLTEVLEVEHELVN